MKRTPLKRGTKGLGQGGGLQRTGRLNPRSDKREAELPAALAVEALVWHRDGGRCQARAVWGERCGGPLDVHHTAGRRSEYERLSPDLLLLVCRRHHDLIHDHPARARALGLLR